jgi:hypothetical protein
VRVVFLGFEVRVELREPRSEENFDVGGLDVGDLEPA